VLEFERLDPEFSRVIPPAPRFEWMSTACQRGEGPVWDASAGCLLWTDFIGGKILKWTPGEGVTTFMDPSWHANGLTFDSQGRLLAAGAGTRSIWRREHDGSITHLASHYEGKRINAPNDLVIRSDGSIFWSDTIGGALSRPGMSGEDVQRYLDFTSIMLRRPNGTVLPVRQDFGNPNGLAFSPDETLLYVADTRRRQIRIFTVSEDGGLSGEDVFYQDTCEEPGILDGMKVDQEGRVYCRGGGGIHVISPKGRLLGRILAERCTNLAWGDADWRTLYVVGHSFFYRVPTNSTGVPVGRA
jgi:gluconolactonase